MLIESTVDRIVDDLSDYSDFRIHQLCKDKPALHQYILSGGK